MSDMNLNSVNWQDGMIVTHQNFKDQEKYLENLMRWHAINTEDHYGLIRKSYTGKSALELRISKDGARLRVEVIRCQALTPNGHCIEIGESEDSFVSVSEKIDRSPVPIFIGVDTRSKKPVGDPDPEEAVPRVPYLACQYVLSVGKAPNLSEGDYIQLDNLEIVENEIKPSTYFYPPCLSLSADDRLSQKALDFKNRLENLLTLSSRAFVAMASEGALSSEKSSLQIAYRETMYHYVFIIASLLDELTTGRQGMHPLRLVVLFKKLFRVFSSLLNAQPGLRDFLNERYFIKQKKADIGQFMAAVDNFLLSDYNHRDIGGHVRIMDDTLNELRGLMGFLAQTKQEQLGKQAVVTETLAYRSRTYKLVEYSKIRVEKIGELSYLLIDVSEPRPIADTVILMAKDLFGVAGWANMQVRLGLNEARGLGEPDPIDIDTTTYGDKVAMHPQDMLQAQAIRQMTLIFRGAGETEKFSELSRSDLIIYAV
jgi:hypothetical protein